MTIMNGQEFGLLEQGFRVPRSADFLEHMVSKYEAETGLTINQSHDSPLYMSFVVASEMYGKQAETLKAVYDSKDPDVATGFALDVLCNLIGISRHLARASTVELELSGDPGVVVTAGKQVEDTHRNRWTITEDATIGASGTVLVDAMANETGPIEAESGEITTIHTPLAGWFSVTNPEPATPGRNRETDDELRLRRAQSTLIKFGSSRAGIRARLLDLDFVQSAEVFDNPMPYPQLIAGVNANANSVVTFITRRDTNTITDIDERRQVAEVLFNSIAAGVVTSGNDDAMTVVASDGTETEIKWSYAETVNVDVVITTTGLADGEEIDLADAITDYLQELLVGEHVSRIQIIAIAAKIGATSAEVTLNGSPNDIEIDSWQIAKLNDLDVVEI